MKPVTITQRVDVVASYGERRDALDQQWAAFLAECGLLAVPVPNNPKVAAALVDMVQPVGLLLTGGNDLAAYGGDAPERDETERHLLERALERGLPVLGVCRGMQVIQHAFDVPMERIEGHVTRHQTVTIDGASEEVNSFHNWGTRETAPELEVWATAADGVVKAVRHTDLRLAGFMWHPERMTPFAARDVAWVRRFFGS